MQSSTQTIEILTNQRLKIHSAEARETDSSFGIPEISYQNKKKDDVLLSKEPWKLLKCYRFTRKYSFTSSI